MIKDLDINFDHNEDTITKAMGMSAEELQQVTNTLQHILDEHGPLQPSRFIEKVVRHDELNDTQKLFALFALGGSKEACGASPIIRDAMQRPLN